MASTDTERREEEEAPAGEDEDTGAQVAPIVKLEEVTVTTGEENEDAILDLYAFLFTSLSDLLNLGFNLISSCGLFVFVVLGNPNCTDSIKMEINGRRGVLVLLSF